MILHNIGCLYTYSVHIALKTSYFYHIKFKKTPRPCDIDLTLRYTSSIFSAIPSGEPLLRCSETSHVLKNIEQNNTFNKYGRLHRFVNGSFALTGHMVQNPPYWMAKECSRFEHKVTPTCQA